jgi:UMF1 family MFS transporter
LLVFTLVCVVPTGLLWFVTPTPTAALRALVLVAIATIGYELAAVFYNAVLPRLAGNACVGRWSGWGWGLGYAGGLASLLLALFAFVQGEGAWLPLDRASAEHVRATFVLVAAWYLVFAVPLFVFVPDTARTGQNLAEALRKGVGQLAESFRHVRQYAHILRFLIARMIYVDGLATIFSFGGIFAAGTFDMSEKDVLLFGIALNVTAGIGAAAFGWLDDRLGSKRTIQLSLLGLLVPGTGMLLARSLTVFWGCGLVLGVFVGPVQAASRSYLARVAPPSLRNQMFGLYAFSGKATSFLGPLLVGWLTVLAGSQRVGMSVIMVFLALGFLLLLTVPRSVELSGETAEKGTGAELG